MQFLHKCRPFYIAGFNVDNLAEAMLAWSPSRAGAAGTAVGAAAIVNVLNQAAAAGLNTVRTWAHTTNPKQPFQVSWSGGAVDCQSQRLCAWTMSMEGCADVAAVACGL